MPERLILMHNRAPGDIVAMTALVRDLQLAHPGRYEVDVQTSHKSLWENNPYITPLAGQPGVRKLKLDYSKGISEQKYSTIHFMPYFHHAFSRATCVQVPLQQPYPDLHLSQQERTQRPVAARYWVILAGGKSDFTIKVWHGKAWQTVVDQLRAAGLAVVQLGTAGPGDWHLPLDGTLNLVGRTNLRNMLQLIYHADGVICGVTAAMHMASALHRPCVVIAGGREAWWWEAYVHENTGLGGAEVAKKHPMPHRFLHTIGQLSCCSHYGCWKNKVVKINKDNLVCTQPILGEQPIATCMQMITPAHVMEAVMSYYTDKSLPPIGAAPAAPQIAALAGATPPAAITPEAATELVMRMAQLLGVNLAPATAAAPAVDQSTKPDEAALPAVVPADPVVMTVAPDGENDGLVATPKARLMPQQRIQQTVAVPAAALTKLAPGFALAGKHAQQAPAIATTPAAAAITIDSTVLDHPDVGGKLTVFVLLYGPETLYDMHKHMLSSLASSCPANRVDLRIGCAMLNPRSMEMVQALVAKGLCTKVYNHTDNPGKYVIMREMFYDAAHPITTKWLVWFDDDSPVARPDWLAAVGQQIVQHHVRDNVHMFGMVYNIKLSTAQLQGYKSRPWYRGKQYRLRNGQPSPSGEYSVFCTGSWWCLSLQAMRECNIPDPILEHNGGDYTIGEQLYQGGFKQKQFNGRGEWVNFSAYARRGRDGQGPFSTAPEKYQPDTIRTAPRLLKQS